MKATVLFQDGFRTDQTSEGELSQTASSADPFPKSICAGSHRVSSILRRLDANCPILVRKPSGLKAGVGVFAALGPYRVRPRRRK